VAPAPTGARGLLRDTSIPGRLLGCLVAVPQPAQLPQGGAELPATAYISRPLVDDVGVDVVERIDLVRRAAGLSVQGHHHELLHLCRTSGRQPPAQVQHPGREQEPQGTTLGQAPATSWEKLPKGKGQLAWCHLPVLQAGISSRELHPSARGLGFAACFPSFFPSHCGFGRETGVGERWENVCALGSCHGGGGDGMGQERVQGGKWEVMGDSA